MVFYDVDGKPSDSEKFCFARSDGSKYWIRFDKGYMLDPNGMYFEPEKLSKFDKKTGNYVYYFQVVSKERFETYLKFLTTKQRAFLRQAERIVE